MQLTRLSDYEKRMMRALLKTPGIRVTKRWCIGKTSKHARILIGRLTRKPNTVDREISFEMITVPYEPKGYDPMRLMRAQRE